MTDPEDFSVAAVISTFDRPDALTVAIRSVQLQSHPVDEIIIVGDRSSDDTEKAIQELLDSRIRFVNLSVRCGEQAIPNAIGTTLATARYVAYLNHDDLWTPQHVELALDRMLVDQTRWFIGQACFSRTSVDCGHARRPIFSEISPANRSWESLFGKTHAYIEPNSGWIIERRGVIESGNWKPAREMRRTPVSSMALQLWRELGDPSHGDKITTVKVLGSVNRSEGRAYGSPSREHEYLANLINTYGKEWFRYVLMEYGPTGNREAPIHETYPDLNRVGSVLTGIASKKWAAHLFMKTGIDVMECALACGGIPQGYVLSRALRNRTGEVALGTTSIDEIAKEINRHNQ